MMATRLRVGDAFLHGPVDGVDQVVVHLAAPFAVAGVDERLAEAGRAAEVHRQHGVAAVGQPLVVRIEAIARRAPTGRRAPAAPSAPVPSAAVPAPGRQRQIGHELEPVARADDLARCIGASR